MRFNSLKSIPVAVFALLQAAAGLVALPAEARVIGRTSEISVGRETASIVEQYYQVDTDPVAAARVRQIGRRLVAATPDADFPFEFHVVESGEVNAFALPGGFIYVFRGLLQLLPTDDALASVLAHEISHVYRRHSIRQFEKNIVLAAGITAVLSGTGASGFGRASNLVQTLASLSFTRHDEEDADENGIRILTRAGYDPKAAAKAMEVVKRAAGEDKHTPSLLRSHPAPESRIRKLNAMAAELLKARGAAQSGKPAPPKPAAVATTRIMGLEALEVEPCEWQPLRAGARWSYRHTAVGVTTSSSVKVLEELRGQAAGVFRVEYDLGRGVRAVRLLAPAGDRVLSRPDHAPAGAAWRVEGVFAAGVSVSDGSGDAAQTVRFVGKERVEVPAGVFEALRVERLGTDGLAESVSWYAPGVGLIKRHTPAAGAVQELTSFSLPRP
ncbi:MAG: M48 family metalloprotease [Actinomycetota bacterium]